MCLAIPLKIEEVLDNDQAIVELNGVRTEISVALIDEPAAGEYVIVHVGYALSKLSAEEAEQTLLLFRSESTADENPNTGEA